MNRKRRAFLVGVAALWVSGCATPPAECRKPDDVSFSAGNATSIAPRGCRLLGSANGSVQAISCENGRQGYFIADIQSVVVQATE